MATLRKKLVNYLKAKGENAIVSNGGLWPEYAFENDASEFIE